MSSGDRGRLEFRLLGPLEVESGGALLPVGGPRQRSVLAFLLLHANEVVRRDALIDAHWGEDPPARAQNALQVAIHGLRKLLRPERIETVGDGYRLRVEAGGSTSPNFSSSGRRLRPPRSSSGADLPS